MEGHIKRAMINLGATSEKAKSQKSNLKRISQTIETIFKKAKQQKDYNDTASKKSMISNKKIEKSEFQTMKQESASAATYSKISEVDNNRALSIKSKKSVQSYKFKYNSFSKDRRTSNLRSIKVDDRSNYSYQGNKSRSNSRMSLGQNSRYSRQKKGLKNEFSNFLFSSKLMTTPKTNVFDKHNLNSKNSKTVGTFNIHKHRRNQLTSKKEDQGGMKKMYSKDSKSDKKSAKRKMTEVKKVSNARKFKSRDMLKKKINGEPRQSFYGSNKILHIAKSKSRDMKNKSQLKLRKHFMTSKSGSKKKMLDNLKKSSKVHFNRQRKFSKTLGVTGSQIASSSKITTSSKKKLTESASGKKFNILTKYRPIEKESTDMTPIEESKRESDIKMNSINESSSSIMGKITSKKIGSSRLINKLDTSKQGGAYFRLYSKQKEENTKLKETIETLVDELALCRTKFEVSYLSKFFQAYKQIILRFPIKSDAREKIFQGEIPDSLDIAVVEVPSSPSLNSVCFSL